MDLDSNAERTLNFQQSGFDEGTLHIADGLDANVTYYMQVLPTRDYVYITYSGRTPYVVAAENNKGKHHMYVEKYDWNGNPVKKYKLNDFLCIYGFGRKKRTVWYCPLITMMTRWWCISWIDAENMFVD